MTPSPDEPRSVEDIMKEQETGFTSESKEPFPTQHQAPPVVPRTSPPAATVPAVPDPNALPSNVRQFEEVMANQMNEMAKTPAFRGAAFPVASGDDVYAGTRTHFQQPGAPANQVERVIEAMQPGAVISEKTRMEMERGSKNVGRASDGDEVRSLREEQDRIEEEQLQGASADGPEQAEAKAREAFRREQTWGGGAVERTTGFSEGETAPPITPLVVPSRA